MVPITTLTMTIPMAKELSC